MRESRCALRPRRHGETVIAQQLLEHRDRRSRIALLALSDRDAGVEQLHLTPSRAKRSSTSPPRTASTYSEPLERRPRQDPALACRARSFSSFPPSPKVARTARRISSERDAPLSCEARSRRASSSDPRYICVLLTTPLYIKWRRSRGGCRGLLSLLVELGFEPVEPAGGAGAGLRPAAIPTAGSIDR